MCSCEEGRSRRLLPIHPHVIQNPVVNGSRGQVKLTKCLNRKLGGQAYFGQRAKNLAPQSPQRMLNLIITCCLKPTRHNQKELARVSTRGTQLSVEGISAIDTGRRNDVPKAMIPSTAFSAEY